MLQLPEHFDIIVTRNMFGDIYLIWPLCNRRRTGHCPLLSGNRWTSEVYFRHSRFGPTLAGKKSGDNPICNILSAAEMLRGVLAEKNTIFLAAGWDATRISDSVTPNSLPRHRHVTQTCCWHEHSTKPNCTNHSFKNDETTLSFSLPDNSHRTASMPINAPPIPPTCPDLVLGRRAIGGPDQDMDE